MPEPYAADPGLPAAPAIESAARERWRCIGETVFWAVALGLAAWPVFWALRDPLGSKDYSLWFRTGQSVLAGEDLYPTAPGVEFPYMYPPFPALFAFAPLSLLGFPLFVGLFVAATAWAWWWSLRWCVRAAQVQRFEHETAVAIAAFVLSLPFACDCFFLGQVNMILLALMLRAFDCLRTARPAWAGGLIGLAAAIKAFPVLALGWLVWRRQWRALGASLATLAVLLVVLPGPLRGFERNLAELDVWTRGMVLDQADDRPRNRAETSFTYRNQSLIALTHRLLRPEFAGERSATAEALGRGRYVGRTWDAREVRKFTVNVADLTPRQAHGVVLLAAAALAAFFIWSARGGDLSGRAGALEFAMVLCLVALFTPKAQTYFFCWLAPAFALTLAVALELPASSQRRGLLTGLGIAGGLLALALAQSFDQITQALGATTLGAIALLLVTGSARRTLRAARVDSAAKDFAPAPRLAPTTS